ncbi:hypothetical protein FB550_10669 [Neobacillus bataviensis]|uniref:Uncharacterized protein n=1 Tax=Neobacillus bataviensis TaxID=220685 RepID=A0A561DCA3_9BACI|nr:hypothetical protein FB550_10669 [Neobacillus bataviensis]
MAQIRNSEAIFEILNEFYMNLTKVILLQITDRFIINPNRSLCFGGYDEKVKTPIHYRIPAFFEVSFFFFHGLITDIQMIKTVIEI